MQHPYDQKGKFVGHFFGCSYIAGPILQNFVFVVIPLLVFAQAPSEAFSASWLLSLFFWLRFYFWHYDMRGVVSGIFRRGDWRFQWGLRLGKFEHRRLMKIRFIIKV